MSDGRKFNVEGELQVDLNWKPVKIPQKKQKHKIKGKERLAKRQKLTNELHKLAETKGLTWMKVKQMAKKATGVNHHWSLEDLVLLVYNLRRFVSRRKNEPKVLVEKI